MAKVLLNFKNEVPIEDHYDYRFISLSVDSELCVEGIKKILLETYKFYTDDIVLAFNNELLENEMSAYELSVITAEITYADYYRFCDGSFFTYWSIIYPYLDQIGTIIGIGGAAIGFGSWLKSKFKKDQPVEQFIDIITSKKSWNAAQFAETLGINRDEAVHILKGLGYEWDSKQLLYIRTARTDEIVRKTREYHKKWIKRDSSDWI